MRELIKTFIPTANLISKTFGCEVVLHDIAVPQNSVVFVAGEVTGREVGQSFDHLVTQVLLSRDFKDDFRANYYFVASNGKRVKSSTSLIRDEKGEVIGALCVNIDVSAHEAAFRMLGEFLGEGFAGSESGVNFAHGSKKEPEDVMQIVKNLIDKIIGDAQPQNLKKDEKKELVRFMDKKGIFAIKGVIDTVAVRMGVSKVTIYGYMDEIKKQEKL